MHAAVDDLISQGLMGTLRYFVVDPCIGGDFNTSVTTRPVFRGRNKPLPYSLISIILGDVPSFDIANRMRGVAAIGVRAQINFHESDYSAVTRFSDQDDQGHCQRGPAFENGDHFKVVLFSGRVGPERRTHAHQMLAIRELSS